MPYLDQNRAHFGLDDILRFIKGVIQDWEHSIWAVSAKVHVMTLQTKRHMCLHNHFKSHLKQPSTQQSSEWHFQSWVGGDGWLWPLQVQPTMQARHYQG